jgi:hypothetical protein
MTGSGFLIGSDPWSKKGEAIYGRIIRRIGGHQELIAAQTEA